MEKAPMGGAPPGSFGFSLESLNNLNHSGSLYPHLGFSGRGDAGRSGEELPSSSSFSKRVGLDLVGSFSDSLYDSFSSCTSQVSNDV